MTRERDSRDHFLSAEDTATSREPGLVCVQAVVPSRLRVVWKGQSPALVRRGETALDDRE
jgi:hypothetical protein